MHTGLFVKVCRGGFPIFGLDPAALIVEQPAESRLHGRGAVTQGEYQLLGLVTLAVMLDFDRVGRAGNIPARHAPAGIDVFRCPIGLETDIRHGQHTAIDAQAETDGQIIAGGLAIDIFPGDLGQACIALVRRERPLDPVDVGELQATDQVVGTVQVVEHFRVADRRPDRLAVVIDTIWTHKAGGLEHHGVELLSIDPQGILPIGGSRRVGFGIGDQVLRAQVSDLVGLNAAEGFVCIGRVDYRGLVHAASGIGLHELEHAVDGTAGEHAGRVQLALQLDAGAPHGDLIGDQRGIGILENRTASGGLQPGDAFAEIDDRAFFPGRIAGIARRGIIDQVDIAGGRNEQVAVFQQDGRVDIDRPSVAALVGAVITGDCRHRPIGDQCQGVLDATVLTDVGGDDRRVDVDAIVGKDLHIVGGKAGDDRLVGYCPGDVGGIAGHCPRPIDAGIAGGVDDVDRIRVQ
ncbi:hypothetical protein D9M71_203700 [compost metagenome]